MTVAKKAISIGLYFENCCLVVGGGGGGGEGNKNLVGCGKVYFGESQGKSLIP